jgi:hypothetical protein
MPIANATISSGTTPFTTMSNGSFIIVAPAGSYTINAAATGYQAKSLSGVSVTSGKVVDASMNVTVATASSKPGDCDNNGTVTIAEVQSSINMFLGLKTVEPCVNVDGVSGVSIAEVQKVINNFLGL